MSGATPTTGGGGAGGAGGTSSNSYNGGTGGSGYAQLVGAGLTIVPTVAVTDNAPVQAGSTFTFTATVTAPSGDPTPTGTMGWAITPPGGGFDLLLLDHGADWRFQRGDLHLLHQQRRPRQLQRNRELPRRLQLHGCFGIGYDGDRLHIAHLRWRGNCHNLDDIGVEDCPYPRGAVSGDLLLLIIAFSDNTVTLGCPGGWTQSGTTSTSTGANAYFESCYKFMTTGTSVSITPPSTNVGSGWTAEVVGFLTLTQRLRWMA